MGLYSCTINNYNRYLSAIIFVGEDSQIMRGAWFIDGTWQPLEANYCEQIEKEHLTFFRGHKLPSEKPDPKATIPGTSHTNIL